MGWKTGGLEACVPILPYCQCYWRIFWTSMTHFAVWSTAEAFLVDYSQERFQAMNKGAEREISGVWKKTWKMCSALIPHFKCLYEQTKVWFRGGSNSERPIQVPRVDLTQWKEKCLHFGQLTPWDSWFKQSSSPMDLLPSILGWDHQIIPKPMFDKFHAEH